MYYEFESRYNMEALIFDDEKLTVGSRCFPYDQMTRLELTTTPMFATYGILTIGMDGKDIPVLFPRSYRSKIGRVLHELEREKEKAKDKKGQDQVQSMQAVYQGAAAASPADPYEEVKKLKELLDLDILTKEEFEKKKKELLRL